MAEHDAQRILEMAREAGVEDHPEVRRWLQGLLHFPHEPWVVEATAQVVGHYADEALRDPLTFRAEYEVRGDASGAWLQGMCEGHAILLDREARKRSEIVVGKPGTGKSSYIALQVEQAVEKGIPTWLFDFKDEFGPLCERLGVASVRLAEMKINPHEWLDRADAVECFAHANLFQNASTGYYRDVLEKIQNIYRESIPNVHCVRELAELMSPRRGLPREIRIDPFRRQTQLARDRVMRALDDILEPYGGMVDCERGFPIEELAEQSMRINCYGMAYKEATYFIYVLLKALYNHRNVERIEQGAFDMPLQNLIVIEEAKHVISAEMERGIKTGPAFIRKITTGVRSAGLGYLFADQVPSGLANSAIESCNTLTLFRVGLEQDLSIIGGAMGLSEAQAGMVHELPDRIAVTKHGEKRPIRVEIPFRPVRTEA